MSEDQPCAECPVILWHTLHDPNNREAERHIRADERRLMQRQLDRANAEIEALRNELKRLRAKQAS